jgi:hypothetical protein
MILHSSSDPEVKKLAIDPELTVAFAAVLNTSLEVLDDLPRTKGQAATYLAKKSLALSQVAGAAMKNQTLDIVNFVGTQVIKSVGLTAVAGMSPGRGATIITLTMAEKIVSAAGLAQIGKCQLAITSLALSTAAGGFLCAGTFGAGCVASAIAVAADAYNVYGQCR